VKIFKIAAIAIIPNRMGDRTQYLLMDDDKQIGKLTIQSNLSKKYYIMTYFKIDDPKKRGQGLGTKLMEFALKDSQYFDRPLILEPAPFIGEETSGLYEMYKKFGFVPLEDKEFGIFKESGWLVYKR